MTVKLRDMVSLSFLVHTQEIADSVRLKDHSLQYVGQDTAAVAGLITGIYGSHSKQTALVAASNWSREREGSDVVNRVLMLDTNYRVDNYSLTREQTRPSTLEQTGWLNLDRVASEYRESIKEQWIDWLRKNAADGVSERMREYSLADIAKKYPRCVTMMLKKDKSIRGIVHPVAPVLDPSVTLWAATVRYEKERFQGAVIRYLPYVSVEL